MGDVKTENGSVIIVTESSAATLPESAPLMVCVVSNLGEGGVLKGVRCTSIL